METTNVMKSILTILISFGLALSVFGQTRNVVVGTNGAIVQPTNFWSADVTNARSGLGLGSAATNSSSAFQPSSVALSNLASSNGSILTNIQASNIVGVISSSNISSVVFTNISGVLTVDQGGTSATNAYGARQNFGITAIGDSIFTASNAATARTAIGGTDVGSSVFTLANPSAITFLRINSDNTVSAIGASDFRTAIGLGSSATNASSAFQPASSMLTNLASSNAFYLSNIQASNITGLLGLTNGGTGADNAINARANLGLGSASTNPASAFQPSSAVLSNLASSNGVNLTNITISNLTGVLATNGNGAGLTNLTAANITGTIAISNGGTGATNADGARTNLGLGWSALTNTNTANFRSAIGLNQSWLTNTNSPLFPDSNGRLVTPVTIYDAVNDYALLTLPSDASQTVDPIVMNVQSGAWDTSNNRTALGLGVSNTPIFNGVNLVSTNNTTMTNQIFAVSQDLNISRNNVNFVGFSGSPDRIALSVPVSFGASPSSIQAATTRTNLGLGETWLTNTNNPVFVSTNGTVISPTNFWQVAPIQTLVQSIIPVTNSTNAATNARNLYVYSLATNVVGVTNTITLPTNTSSFDGDEVTVIHRGGSNSVTAIRQLGSTNNLISLNSYDESVKFIKDGNWDFYHNISFTEAIKFSGTNAVANAAASRTNLGLGNSSSPEFASLLLSDLSNTNAVDYAVFVDDTGSFYSTSGGAARTNLGLPLAALTNTSVTNFQKAIFYTNTAPSNIGGNLGSIAAWIEIVASNGVTYKVPAYTNIP